MTRAKKTDGVQLPGYVPEDGYPEGDGPAWVTAAIGGAAGAFTGASGYRSDNGDSASIVLHFSDGTDQLFHPARMIVTRRLAETLSALGFPVPYYGPPQLALLGQAIARIANRGVVAQETNSALEFCSVVAGWAINSLDAFPAYVLSGRKGPDVRAAIEHVRSHYVGRGGPSPIVVEPARGVLLLWTTPVASVIREKLGTTHDALISTQLKRGGAERSRLAARPAGEHEKTVELPVWMVYNGWQGVDAGIPLPERGNDPSRENPLWTVRDHSHMRAQGAHAHTHNERSTTPNAERAG